MPDTSIHQACGRGDIDAVQAMIAADSSVVDEDDEHNWRPIFHAVIWRQQQIVQLLIDSGADLAAHDGDVLHYAAEVPGNKAILALLIQYGALDAHVRPTDDMSRQFFAALFLGNVARVGTLLDRRPALAAENDGRGDAPLHHAARNGDTDIVQLLLERGADVHALTPRGHTVLYCAGGHGHVDTLQILLDHGADPDVKFTHDGKTLLEWLDQYPDDGRFAPVAEVLRRRKGP